MAIKTYRKKETHPVIAVQLDLETDGFTYRKWGAEQRCKAGDWIVDNDGEVYSIDNDSFQSTYERISPGVYRKTAVIHAEVATEAGSIETREGLTHYAAGDYIVSNGSDGSDTYAVEADKFEAMYEEVEE